jgi:anti-sigma regulatory factor (Ser/Thr protein kinase)
VGTDDLGLVHELTLYGSDGELLATAVPFLRAGLDAGEVALVTCSVSTTELLLSEFGDDPRIEYLDRHNIYRTPAGAIAAYREVIDDYVGAGAGRVRVVAEAALGNSRVQWDEWGRYEAVVNRALQGYPASAICAYDTRSTPLEVLASSRATHPYLVQGTRHLSNPAYVEPEAYLRSTATTAPEALEWARPALEIHDLTDLDHLRRRLESALYRQTHALEPAADFMLAVHEVATNAIRHGEPPVSIRLWESPHRFLCRVTDRGPGFDDPLVGYTWPGNPDNAATHGMGLWLARRLCDRVDVFRTGQGFTVRLLRDVNLPLERPRPSPQQLEELRRNGAHRRDTARPRRERTVPVQRQEADSRTAGREDGRGVP